MNTVMIPYQIRATLLQLEPSTDLNWKEIVSEILEHEEIDVREEIDRQILKPKEIQWNRVTNSFEYKISNSLHILKHSFSNERMRSIAAKLTHSTEWLKKTTDSLQIADYLENALQQIDLIPVNDDLTLQREKLLIRRVFLQDVANIIRKLKLVPPKGIRQLTAEQIKCFIIEVYIKQQLLGYWFKPLLPKYSQMMQHPFFKYFLLKEQDFRKFDIVQTSEFIFLIAPIQHFGHNPYSIRRFLIEEQMEYEGHQQIYLNSVVVELSRIKEGTYAEEVSNYLQKMITIQHQVHKDVLEIVADFEHFVDKKLVPYLMEPLGLNTKNSEGIVNDYLKNIENMIMSYIFLPLRNAVKSDLSHIEEFEYLFMSVHRILSEILGHYRDFKEQPSLFFNTDIKLLEYRIMAYLKLLEKRKDEIFIPMYGTEWAKMNERSQQPVRKIQDLLEFHMQDFCDLKTYMGHLLEEQTMTKGSFLKRIIKGEKVEKDLIQAEAAAMRMKKQAYLDIIAVPKSLLRYSVFIEFESLTSMNEFERHYAFPNGDNGLTRLPVLMKIPENLGDFDFEAFNASIMRYDVRFSSVRK